MDKTIDDEVVCCIYEAPDSTPYPWKFVWSIEIRASTPLSLVEGYAISRDHAIEMSRRVASHYGIDVLPGEPVLEACPPEGWPTHPRSEDETVEQMRSRFFDLFGRSEVATKMMTAMVAANRREPISREERIECWSIVLGCTVEEANLAIGTIEKHAEALL
jgi:hypothetical protein